MRVESLVSNLSDEALRFELGTGFEIWPVIAVIRQSPDHFKVLRKRASWSSSLKTAKIMQ